MNLDIQGAELEALKGLGSIEPDLKIIYTEVNREQLYAENAMIEEIDRYLSGYEFRRVLTHWTNQGWGDAVYVRNIGNVQVFASQLLFWLSYYSWVDFQKMFFMYFVDPLYRLARKKILP